MGLQIMFRIKKQVQTSHLLILQAYKPKSHFRDKVIPILSLYRIQNQILSRQSHSNTSILPNTKPNSFTYHVSHQGTSSDIPFIKLGGIQTKISFSRKGQSNTFILPNTKSNRSTYHVCIKGHQRTSFPIYKTSRHGSFQYFHFTEYKTKQVHISCLHQGTSTNKFSHLSNFATWVIPILSFYRIRNQIGTNIMLRIKGHRRTS